MTSQLLHYRLLKTLVLGFTLSFFISCSGNKQKETVNNNSTLKSGNQKYDGVTISLDISNKNWISILLAADGTINRKGDKIFDPADKNFFMGITDSKAFDSLMNDMPEELTDYCNTPSPEYNTSKQTCKARIDFGNSTTLCKIEYCVNGTFSDLPKPIKDFIERSIDVTEPWYLQQQKQLKKNSLSFLGNSNFSGRNKDF